MCPSNRDQQGPAEIGRKGHGMRNSTLTIGVLAALASAAALSTAPTIAQEAPAAAQAPSITADGHPDIQGYWAQTDNVTTYSLQDGAGDRAEHTRITGQRTATGRPIVDPPDGRIPYQPWAAAKAKHLYDVHNGPETIVDLDPVARGFMEGTPRINLQTGFQILQTPGQVVFLYEYGHHFRVVPIDGRPHLDSTVSLWMGDSRGHWEGNTLVIGVANHNDQTWFDQVGSFHSTALRVTERWTFSAANRLEYEVVIDDSKVFTQPWKMRLTYARNQDPTYEQLESAVWEGNRAVELMVRPKPAPARRAAATAGVRKPQPAAKAESR